MFLRIFPNVDVILQQCYKGLSKFLATETGQVLVGAGRVQPLNLKQKY